MNKTIESHNIAENEPIQFPVELPKICPRCSTSLNVTPLTSYSFFPDGFFNCDKLRAYVIYFCTNCEKCFLAEYELIDTGYEYRTELISLLPTSHEVTDFTNKIKALSPKFIKIYHQAEQAEQIGLNEICGSGYRKSLEFLIKDYAIAFNPDDTEKIKNQMLSPCINEYIDNDKIKSLATASAWIGNDETHYNKKHEDYNLQHLKAFINSIVSFIDSDLSYLEALQLLAKPKE